MNRYARACWQAWLPRKRRRPLVVSSARQRGKADPVEEFAHRSFAPGETRISAAEVDYVVARGGRIVPVAVKAGKTGRRRSLRQFVAEKQAPLALRFNADQPSLLKVADTLPDGTRIAYRLLSWPLYLVEHAYRLLDEAA